MHQHSVIYWILVCLICTIFARRDLYESKCKRSCNTEQGSFKCWKTTTDGFAYGLSTAMIDFCQTILQIRDLTNVKGSWYNSTRAILVQQIERYELEGDVRQLTKENIEQTAVSLLDQCFDVPRSIISPEPSCLSCSGVQTQKIKQWRLSSIILLSIGLFLAFVILFLYILQSHYIDRSSILIR